MKGVSHIDDMMAALHEASRINDRERMAELALQVRGWLLHEGPPPRDMTVAGTLDYVRCLIWATGGERVAAQARGGH